MGRFDHRLLTQAITNVVKNATESVQAALSDRPEGGHIDVTVEEDDGVFVIQVTDNGIGLPETQRQRLLEPYITTREKGTGLGLAIVGKVLEEHGGRIELLDPPDEWHDGHGARVCLILPILAVSDKTAEPASDDVKSGDEETESTSVPEKQSV